MIPAALVGANPSDKLWRRRLIGCVVISLLASACGKEGPPLPPLHLVPSPVTDVVVRRQGNEVRFTFVLPTRNLNGPGPVNLDRVEIFAATVAAGAIAPPNRELMTAPHRSAVIEVKPPPPPGGGEPKQEDLRPGPGDTVTFVEELNEARLKPTFTTPMPAPGAAQPASPTTPGPTGAVAGAPTTLPGAPVAVLGAPTTVAAAPTTPVAKGTTAAAPAQLLVTKRIYTIRGLARGGRPGQPSARIEIPLVDPPPSPSAVAAKFSESAVTLVWLPPVGEFARPPTFNVYAGEGGAPLNPSPLATPAFERSGVELGKEQCFVVRTVVTMGSVAVESGASERACVTPTDVFPPAAPKGLSAVAGSGVISLIWDASPESDLAGYVVLRGEAPGDTLQPLTPSPIRDTTYRDTTVKPGVRYVYAVVAADRATPPNLSAQSTRVEETAR